MIIRDIRVLSRDSPKYQIQDTMFKMEIGRKGFFNKLITSLLIALQTRVYTSTSYVMKQDEIIFNKELISIPTVLTVKEHKVLANTMSHFYQLY